MTGFSDIQAQIIFLSAALALGVFTGLLFDIYRRMRNLVSPGPFLTALGDLCFWSIITAITFASLLKVNFGKVRGYIFLGIIMGLFFYLLVFSAYVIQGFVLLELNFKKVTHKACSVVYKLGEIKIITLPKRIIEDARRIYLKIKRK